MSPRAVSTLFGVLAATLAAVGVWSSSWWPFAGAVGALAVATYALTAPPEEE